MLVEWQTGFEVDNLGFRLYRDDAGRRTLVTPNLVAGSALTVGPKTVLGAGNAYSWTDPGGRQSSAYWLEAINTDDQSELSGPFYPTLARDVRMPRLGRAATLDQLGGNQEQMWQHQWWPAASIGVTAASK